MYVRTVGSDGTQVALCCLSRLFVSYETQESLHAQQELTETWTAQVRVLGAQLEKMVRLCEENAGSAKHAQKQVIALQVRRFDAVVATTTVAVTKSSVPGS